MARRWLHAWGEATAFLRGARTPTLADLVVVGALGGLAFAIARVAHGWTGALRPTVEIDLSPAALPGYALLSLSRGLLAYVLSFLFTLGYGSWAAHDRRAERVLVPLLDVLQSVPVLGFMPGLVLALVALFPRSSTGLELAAVLMIFTGQAWNMTFSYYRSVRSLPADQLEAARVYRFTPGERFRWVELPASAIGLVWNSMMSMAGGWFFLMVSEAFVLGDKDFRLPGLGSYMSVAVARGDGAAMAWAVLAMALMIVALDQLLWRPVVVWSEKFRLEEGGGASEAASSWFLTLLRRSHLLAAAGAVLGRAAAALRRRARAHPGPAPAPRAAGRARGGAAATVALVLLLGGLALGSLELLRLLRAVPPRAWLVTGGAAGVTLLRVLVSTALGTLWAVPAGLAIGLSPRLSRALQPVVQVVASFPAPMLFPAALAALRALGVGLGVGSVVLMLLGTQWYILFNVVAGAMAIPADLREAARSYRIRGFALFRRLHLPAVLPYLVTGWVTAAGGAWNASIVSEYVTVHGTGLATFGLGARISAAAERADFPLLAASGAVRSLVVVVFNRLVWRPVNDLAERRYTLLR
ncbi:MAG TPA: ABC transporter permease subunit [Anaeromyxobacteraceae bacterium]|nr:ABC transporter permease subunit [Anaeromyxobacteraceae bacterium]